MANTNSINDRLMDNFYAAEKVDPNTLAVESELIYLKFPDYAFISATEATRMFLRRYSEVYRKFYERYKSALDAEHKRGVKAVDLFANPQGTINALWKARQFADALGVEYEFYIRAAFKHLVEIRKYKNLPAPNQLYSEHVIKFVDKSWQERLKDPHMMYPHANDPRFKFENYCGEPAQDRYRQVQIERIRADKSLIKKRLGGFCFTMGTLDPEIAVSEFGIPVTEVKSDWNGAKHEYTDDIDHTDFRRPCFGMLHVKPVKECMTCIYAKSCDEEQKRVGRMMIERHGTQNPRADIKREQARERKRRQRERERLSALVGMKA